MAKEELKKEEPKPVPKKIKSNHLGIIVFLIAVAAIGGGIYWQVSSKTVYIDQSVIQAPVINLSPANSGPLQAVFVNVGDMVTANQPIARVGDEIVESKTSGEIVSIDQNIGEFENALSGQSVVANDGGSRPVARRRTFGRKQGALRREGWRSGKVYRRYFRLKGVLRRG